MGPKLIYIANASFPADSAYATRVYYLCMIYRELGYEVTIISLAGKKETVSWIKDDPPKVVNFSNSIDGWKKNLDNMIHGGRRLSKLLSKIKEEKPDAVIMGGGYTRLFGVVQRFCRRWSSKLIVESCEWYNYGQFPSGFMNPFFWDHNIAVRLLYKKANGIIAISSYLQEYFENAGVRTIRIPTILDSRNPDNYDENVFEDSKLNIVYAGFLGKQKDDLGTVLSALVSKLDFLEQMKLHIIGPTEDQVRRIAIEAKIPFQQLRKSVIIYGRQPRERTIQFVSQADFTILMRKDTRNSRAGFPTKLAESMVYGTPVIANLTGDIGLYLKDLETGLIIRHNSARGIAEGLERAVRLTREDLQRIRENCKETALKYFDYRAYVEKIADFMGDIYR
ncbi:glycosyltransferase [Mesotoga sp.]|uniref:glycosyltransferase n=1 Tax=Mesotoga sp. TaxID=2053577 RepID=UPI001BD4B08E|nr:glycosyltransferase [Mesotoga sp.]